MAVIVKFIYEVKSGRMADFMTKLKQAADLKFHNHEIPKSFRLFRNSLSNLEAHRIVILIEYEDMAAYTARTAYENSNPEWRKLFAATHDSPERLVSMEVLTEFYPTDTIFT